MAWVLSTSILFCWPIAIGLTAASLVPSSSTRRGPNAIAGLPQTPQAEVGRKNVVVKAADTKVWLQPDTSSPVVATPPLGSVLEVVATSGDWLQVRLPKDGSGFERFGFVNGSCAGPAATVPVATTTVPARPSVAVLDFDYATVKQEWSGITVGNRPDGPAIMDVVDVGKGIADLLVDELLAGGEVRLLDRRHLDVVLQEQDLARGDRAAPSASEVAQLKKVLSAKYFVTGSVTKFGTEDKQISGSALGLKGFAGFLAGFGKRDHTGRVGVTARIIDSSTGEILASVRAEADSKRKGLLLGGLGGGHSGGGGSFEIGSSNFQQTILGEAMVLAVRDAAKKLCAAVRQLSLEPPR